MTYHKLNLRKAELLKQQAAKEAEIKEIFKILNDAKLSNRLLSGRDYWVKMYNRKILEYRAFCIKHTLKMSICEEKTTCLAM